MLLYGSSFWESAGSLLPRKIADTPKAYRYLTACAVPFLLKTATQRKFKFSKS
jgi:hypothetical protein